jgi:hypothetical protein
LREIALCPSFPLFFLLIGDRKPERVTYNMNKFIILLSSVAVLASASITALGHHSFAMFDLTKRITIKGVVQKVEWTNPHVWVYAEVPQKDGSPVRWGIEFTSVNHLTRLGMKANTIKAGDTIEFQVNPYADGTPGGRFQIMKLPSGRYFCDVGAVQQFCAENNK